jgi:hypothetical protein
MTLVVEVPYQRIKIVQLAEEFDVQIITEYIGYFVKTFEAAIIVNHCFGTTEVGT